MRPLGVKPGQGELALGGERDGGHNVIVRRLALRASAVSKSPQQTPHPHEPAAPPASLLNRIARVLLCLVFIHAVIGKLRGFDGVAGAIAAKGLPLAPVLLVADQDSRG